MITFHSSTTTSVISSLSLQAFASLGKDVIVDIDHVIVQELVGEGTFAKVFKATLRQEKPSLPVSDPPHITMIQRTHILASVHITMLLCTVANVQCDTEQGSYG